MRFNPPIDRVQSEHLLWMAVDSKRDESSIGEGRSDLVSFGLLLLLVAQPLADASFSARLGISTAQPEPSITVVYSGKVHASIHTTQPADISETVVVAGVIRTG